MHKDLKEISIPMEIVSDKDKTVEYLMDKGQKYEEVNEREAALKSYEQALAILEVNEMNETKIQLYIKIGDLYQICGEIDSGLKFFNLAYDFAVLENNVIFQIDALIRIAEGYSVKGELETSVKYGEKVNELIKDIDYIQGELELSIFWIKIHYIKNEFFKARDLGNEAIKLCGGDYLIYKGRILNVLARLYSDITGVDEHLDLLKQALECFEKANFKKGILSVLNNIGVVYAEKLQDNEKALEYFLRLVNECEEAGIIDLGAAVSGNIGENYYKSLRYEEAMKWYESALSKGKKSGNEYVVFYCYVFLSKINLILGNYKDAYYFFNLASEELINYPDQGSMVAYYYKLASSLWLEFGQVDIAKEYIKKAFSIPGNEELTIKWNVGLAYEFIKLKEAKNQRQIIDSLNGITYILSKYKNVDLILDSVYGVAIELIGSGYMGIAFKFVDEYKHMTSTNEVVDVKYRYIEAMRGSDVDKIQNLKNVLPLSLINNNRKIQFNILNNMGEQYFAHGDFHNGLSSFYDACQCIKNIINDVPEEFRVQFVNFHKLLKPFNRFVETKEQIDRIKYNSFNKYETISNEEQLYDIFESEIFNMFSII